MPGPPGPAWPPGNPPPLALFARGCPLLCGTGSACGPSGRTCCSSPRRRATRTIGSGASGPLRSWGGGGPA
eukprot:916388-Heterocapsa_arctica.AAC.1